MDDEPERDTAANGPWKNLSQSPTTRESKIPRSVQAADHTRIVATTSAHHLAFFLSYRSSSTYISSSITTVSTRFAMSSTIYQATCSAPVNIAVIKYWGKKDTTLILPTNDSLSVTLDQDHLRSVTTARADASFGSQDRLWLNGEEEAIKADGRLRRCIDEMRKLRQAKESKDSNLAKVRLQCTARFETELALTDLKWILFVQPLLDSFRNGPFTCAQRTTSPQPQDLHHPPLVSPHSSLRLQRFMNCNPKCRALSSRALPVRAVDLLVVRSSEVTLPGRVESTLLARTVSPSK